MINLLVGQRGGRFIHNNQLDVPRERLGNLDHLLNSNVQIAYVGVQGKFQTQLLQNGGRTGTGLFGRISAMLEALIAQHDVFVYLHVRNQTQFLVNHADAARERLAYAFMLTGLAHEGYLALVGFINAGDNFDNRTFSCAVFTNQPVNLSIADLQVHMIQRLYAGKCFGHVFDLQKKVRHCACSFLCVTGTRREAGQE